jgi:hypothetical protein
VSLIRTVSFTIGLAALLAGCAKPREHVRSVEEFIEEPAILHGVVLSCNARRDHAMREPECINAWAAVERMGQADDARQDRVREKEFEKNRERVRLAREQQAAAAREAPYDPYRAPVVTDAPGSEHR